MDAVDVALLVLRVWIGLVVLLHGINHARSLDGTAGWFASVGFRNAALQARISAFGEVVLGVALIAGLVTSVAAAGVIATLTVAFWSIHRFAGFFVFERPDEGYEYVATLAVAALALAMTGPGDVSLDHALGIADTLDGWVGALIALGGVAAAAGHLALFWRRPQERTGEET